MVRYMLRSILATFITEGIIFIGVFLYETENIAGEYRKVWGASGEGTVSFRMLSFSQSASLDFFVILLFTVLLFIIYFVLISHNFVMYVREIIAGIEHMKNGEFTEEIPVRGEDEFSEIAVSINEMRKDLYETLENQRIAERTDRKSVV